MILAPWNWIDDGLDPYVRGYVDGYVTGYAEGCVDVFTAVAGPAPSEYAEQQLIEACGRLAVETQQAPEPTRAPGSVL